MAADWTIRRATAADAAEVTRLYRDFFGSQFAIDTFGEPNPDFDVARFVHDRLADPSFMMFVAEQGGRTVGFSDCHVRALHGAAPPLNFGGVRPLARSLYARWKARRANPWFQPYVEGYLNNLYIEPDVRRRGLGSALTQCRVDALRARGVDRMRAHTLYENTPAQEMLWRLGFQPTMYVVEWFPPDDDDGASTPDVTH